MSVRENDVYAQNVNLLQNFQLKVAPIAKNMNLQQRWNVLPCSQ